jgi:hypothetical protein
MVVHLTNIQSGTVASVPSEQKARTIQHRTTDAEAGEARTDSRNYSTTIIIFEWTLKELRAEFVTIDRKPPGLWGNDLAGRHHPAKTQHVMQSKYGLALESNPLWDLEIEKVVKL